MSTSSPVSRPLTMQNHEVLSDYLALDFAGHSERPGGILLRFAFLTRNSLANRNVLKK